MSQLSLFDEIDQVEADRVAVLRAESEKPVTCSHCGEVSRNAYLDSVNHGIVFNGWCGKRLWYNSWANANEAWAVAQAKQFAEATEWLAEHGWVACDEHDRANWVEGHIPYWEVQK